MPRCSPAASNLGFFFSTCIHGFRLWSLMFDHSSDQNVFLVLLWPVSLSVCLEPTYILLDDICWAARNVSHRSMVQTMTCLHPCSYNHRWSPPEVHQCLFVSEHRYLSDVSDNRPSEHWVSSVEQHDSDRCNLPFFFRNLVGIQDLDLDLGLLLFLLEIFIGIVAWGRLPLCTQQWVTAINLAIFRKSCMGMQIHCLFSECPHLLIGLTLREFQLMALFWDLQYPLSLDHQYNFTPHSERIPRIWPGRTFLPNWCIRPWSFDDARYNFSSAQNGMIGPSNSELNRRAWGVWPPARLALHVSEIAVTLHCFSPPNFLEVQTEQYWRSAFFHSSFSLLHVLRICAA